MMRRISIDHLNEVLARTQRFDTQTVEDARSIVEAIRSGGASAARAESVRLGDLATVDGKVVYDRADLDHAAERLDADARGLLRRAAERIERFARSQREGLADGSLVVPGGRAGYRWVPVETAGAYAPGGRYPLPSSVLMTVIPARVAGVESVWVASPRPDDITLAAASIAGADALIGIGGAQAIASLAFGVFGPPADVIVGPGNRWVTAAKMHLYGEVGIDGIAGPSEVLVIADDGADPDLVASDLLAQAEHDEDAVPMIATTSTALADAVDAALRRQLQSLSTAPTTRAAIENGFCVVVDSVEAAVAASNRIAPEHLSIHTANPQRVAGTCTAFGTVFIGEGTTESHADYGAGPNHVLPTNGSARFQSGLSVLDFLRCSTWLQIEDPTQLAPDTTAFANLEGLEAHSRAAAHRVSIRQSDNPMIR